MFSWPKYNDHKIKTKATMVKVNETGMWICHTWFNLMLPLEIYINSLKIII